MQLKNSMPTNDVFHHLCRLLVIHKDKDLIIDLFASEGMSDVTRSKIKAWDTKAGNYGGGYRAMPRPALDVFIAALYKKRLVSIDDDEGVDS